MLLVFGVVLSYWGVTMASTPTRPEYSAELEAKNLVAEVNGFQNQY